MSVGTGKRAAEKNRGRETRGDWRARKGPERCLRLSSAATSLACEFLLGLQPSPACLLACFLWKGPLQTNGDTDSIFCSWRMSCRTGPSDFGDSGSSEGLKDHSKQVMGLLPASTSVENACWMRILPHCMLPSSLGLQNSQTTGYIMLWARGESLASPAAAPGTSPLPCLATDAPFRVLFPLWGLGWLLLPCCIGLCPGQRTLVFDRRGQGVAITLQGSQVKRGGEVGSSLPGSTKYFVLPQ